MVHGRRSAAWSLLAEVLAQQANIYREKGASVITAEEVNPYSSKNRGRGPKEAKDVIKVSPKEWVTSLAQALCPGRANFPKGNV
jgi:hypothetical protein